MLSYHLSVSVFYKNLYKKVGICYKDVNAHTILLLAQHDIRYTLNYYYIHWKSQKNTQRDKRMMMVIIIINLVASYI